MNRTYHHIIAIVSVVVLGVGCATGGGKSDEELIQETLATWTKGIVELNLDTMMTAYSDNYTAEGRTGKEPLREFLDGVISQGYLDKAEVVTDEMKIVIEGETATAGPIDLRGAMGAISLDQKFAKEDGQWLIVGTETY